MPTQIEKSQISMKFNNTISSIIIFSLCSTQLLSQGAIDGYMKQKKETDFALTYSYESYDKYYFGKEIQNISVQTKSASLFVAHGLNNNLNLILSIPYMSNNGGIGKLQDAIISMKYRGKKIDFDNSSLSRISAFGFSFPISNYSTEVNYPIGQRATSFQLRHLYQYEISGYFIHLQSGFDFRFIPSAQFSIPFIFRTGYAHSKFYVDSWLEYFHTMNSGIDQNISAGEGSSFLKIGGTLYVPIKPFLGVFVGGAHFLTGRNIGKASRINIGLVLKRI